jgi:hypothetical protein
VKNPASAQGAAKTAAAGEAEPGDADAAGAEDVEAWLADGTAWGSAFGDAGNEPEGAGAAGCPCSNGVLEPDELELLAGSSMGISPWLGLVAT